MGGPQSSLVTVGLAADGDLVVSTYPERAKVANVRPQPAGLDGGDVGRLRRRVGADRRSGPRWSDLPDAVEDLVEYFRCISGEHPDWDEYRQAMIDQGKCLIRIAIEDWGPIAKGGFPARMATGD